MKVLFFLLIIPILFAFDVAFGASYTTSTETQEGKAEDNGNNNICDGDSVVSDAASVRVRTRATTSSEDCYLAYVEFPIAAIPDASTVTEVNFTFTVSSVVNARTCDYVAVNAQPSVDAIATVFSDILTGTVTLNNDSECTTTGTKSVILGTDFNTYTQNQLPSDYITIGIKHDNITLDASDHYSDITDTSVTIKYLPAIDAVDDLNHVNLSENSLDLTWTQPTLRNNAELRHYLVNFTTPLGDPLTKIEYTNNTFSNVTGLAHGTPYSFRVTGITQGSNLSNITAVNPIIHNVTTTSNTYATPPANLTVNDCYHTCTTQLNLEWLASAMDNINGYRIEHKLNSGSWTTLVSNTSNTNLFYNHTGLNTGDIHRYRVYSMNQTGISTVSNEVAYTTHKLPDAVDDLTAVATSISSVDLSWTSPTHYAVEILGYQINFTTPAGDPQTPLVNNTGSTTVVYEVTGIPIGSESSFRVSAITIHGKNATGNIANATVFSEFTIGEIEIPTESSTPADIRFVRTDIDSTTLNLNVIFPNGAALACDFDYEFANINKTYTGQPFTSYEAGFSNSSFTFTNIDNEIVDVYCWDINNNETDGTFILTQTQFVIMDQVDEFRDGDTWNTQGNFGAFDFITLLVVIISMAGFQKKNTAAGVLISIIVVTVAGVFQIIEPLTIVFGALALVAMVAIGQQRKDD